MSAQVHNDGDSTVDDSYTDDDYVDGDGGGHKDHIDDNGHPPPAPAD